MLPDHHLQQLRVDGLHFGLRGGKLAVGPRERITDAARSLIEDNREVLVRLIAAETPPSCPHGIFERAAILEFDGGYSREEADALALAEFSFASWEADALAQLGAIC